MPERNVLSDHSRSIINPSPPILFPRIKTSLSHNFSPPSLFFQQLNLHILTNHKFAPSKDIKREERDMRIGYKLRERENEREGKNEMAMEASACNQLKKKTMNEAIGNKLCLRECLIEREG